MEISINKDELYTIIKNAMKEVINEEEVKIFKNTIATSQGGNDPFLDYITNEKTAAENKYNLTDISTNHDKYLY